MIRRTTLLAAVAASAFPVLAQADFVPEIPGTETLAPSARSASMGGTGIAASEETGALLSNPAAIALVRRSEATATFGYQQRDLTSGYFDTDRTASLTSGELTSAGFVYPVDVYRGALAFGFTFHRQSLFDRELLRGGGQPGGGRETEYLAETGSLDSWTFGGAVQLSPSAFVGANVSLLTGALDRQSEFAFTAPDGDLYDFLGES